MRAQTLTTYRSIANDAVELILNELDTDLSCAVVADRLAVSPFFFHRLFKAMVGEGPLELIQRLRMERAAHELGQENKSVTEIAFDSGYESLEGFSREFKRRFGSSPSQFQSSREHRPQLCSPNGIHWGLPFVALPGETNMITSNLTYTRTEFAPVRVSALRHIGPYQQIGSAFAQLRPAPGPRRMFALYYDNPETTDPKQLRSDACCEILPGEKVLEGLSETEIAGGNYVVLRYKGPYTGISEAWSTFMQLVARDGITYRDAPSFEEYLNTPMNTAPEDLITDLYSPTV